MCRALLLRQFSDDVVAVVVKLVDKKITCFNESCNIYRYTSSLVLDTFYKV